MKNHHSFAQAGDALRRLRSWISRPVARGLCFFLLAVCGAGLSGCMTLHSPKRLTREQRSVVADAGLSRLTVGVVAGKHVSAEGLEDWRLRIERTGLFKKVEILDRCAEPPDLCLCIVSTAQLYFCMTGPGSLEIMTLGIVPAPLTYDRSVNLEVMTAEPNQSLVLAYKSRQREWYGWLISVLALSPNWTLNRPDEERYVDDLAFFIASRRADILARTSSR